MTSFETSSPARLAEPVDRSRGRSFNFDDLCLRALVQAAKRLQAGQCTIALPDGAAVTTGVRTADGPSAVIHVRNARMARKVLTGASLGFAEAYLDGDWDTPDLVALLEFALVNEPALGAAAGGLSAMRWAERLWNLTRRNSRRGSRRNISEHYDVGNDFFALWLDPTMSYSAALFSVSGEDLAVAQRAKYVRMAEMVDLAPGQNVLEIGCGWGEFALMAAQEYDCRVTAITLSAEQAAFVRERVRMAGLQDRVDVRLMDYRDIDDRYDRIVSIEMFEAVGEAYWPRFFEVLRRSLRAGGIAGMQVITIADHHFATYRSDVDFIQKYVFPGGMLPSPSVFRRQIGRAGLRLTDAFTFGGSYAMTLERWRTRFAEAWPQIRALGFDEVFRRRWEYYLAYCEAGFRAGSIDVGHYRIERRTGAPAL